MFSEREWIRLINEIKNIRSETHKKDLLINIARELPASEALKTAFLDATNTISSLDAKRDAIREIEKNF